jgi:glycosyltransferase involved in cell wall biosynthesis
MSRTKFIVITPAKNEANYIQKTIDSVVSQTLLPSEWLIVDDCSSDDTALLAERAARRHPWIKVVRRVETGKRDVGYGDTRAFMDGLSRTGIPDYEFMFKIDADVVLKPPYFQKIFQKFAANPRLGIGVGEVDELVGSKLVPMRALPHGFNGMIKGWRRACFEAIGGIPRGPGWDGLDCYRAMMLGWETTTFPDADLRVVHLRPEGSSVKNRYEGWARHGRALHFSGAHPLWILASACYHMAERPFVLGGVCLILGYFESVLKKSKQYGDQDFRRYLRRWQLRRLTELLRLR